MAAFNFTNMSVFIPHIHITIPKEQVIETFENNKIGKVKSVDLVIKKNSGANKETHYHIAFVHFDFWFENEDTRKLQEKILDPLQEARLMYENPWYWVLLKNHTAFKKRPAFVDIAIALGTRPSATVAERVAALHVTVPPAYLVAPVAPTLRTAAATAAATSPKKPAEKCWPRATPVAATIPIAVQMSRKAPPLAPIGSYRPPQPAINTSLWDKWVDSLLACEN